MMSSHVPVKETVSRNSSETGELQRKDEYPRTYKRKHRWTHSDWNCGF